MRKKLLLVFLLIFVSTLLAGQSLLERDVYIESIRSTAMGGFHVGMAEDFDILFSNPAGYKSVREQVRFSQLSLSLHGPVFDFTDLILRTMDGEDIIELLETEENINLVTSLYAGLNTIGPLSFSFVGGGIGFGIFNKTGMLFESPATLELHATVFEEIILIGGYSFEIPLAAEKHTIETGINLKGFFRGESGFTTSILLLSEIMDEFSSSSLMGQPFNLILGIGFDLGLRYVYDDIISIGLVGQDIYTPTMRTTYVTLDDFISNTSAPVIKQYGAVPFKLNCGITFKPRLTRLQSYISDFILSVDYNDILDFVMYPQIATHPLLHIGAGAELTILDILALRGGISEGLFSAGIGVQLGLANLGLSMYGKELSTEPGLYPVYNLMISVSVEK